MNEIILDMRGKISNKKEFFRTLQGYIFKGYKISLMYQGKNFSMDALDYYLNNDFTRLYQIIKKCYKNKIDMILEVTKEVL